MLGLAHLYLSMEGKSGRPNLYVQLNKDFAWPKLMQSLHELLVYIQHSTEDEGKSRGVFLVCIFLCTFTNGVLRFHSLLGIPFDDMKCKWYRLTMCEEIGDLNVASPKN